jgi:hypothetical protein
LIFKGLLADGREQSMTKKPFMALALCACLTVAVFAAPAAPAKKSPVTVGDFAVKVAASLGYEVPNATAAMNSLRGRGLAIGTDAGAMLSEGEAARIAADLGVSIVAPSNPNVGSDG